MPEPVKRVRGRRPRQPVASSPRRPHDRVLRALPYALATNPIRRRVRLRAGAGVFAKATGSPRPPRWAPDSVWLPTVTPSARSTSRRPRVNADGYLHPRIVNDLVPRGKRRPDRSFHGRSLRHLAGCTRGARGIVRPVPGLDHGLHAHEVRIHFAFRIGAERFRNSVTDRAGERHIPELDVHPRTAIAVGIESHHTAVPDRRTRLRAPLDALVGNDTGHLGNPFDRHAGRPGHDPAGAVLVERLHFTHIRHEKRKILIVAPEREH